MIASSKLSTIIWLGDTTSIPKGWAIPTSGKKLRIKVPLKDGFREFVIMTKDSISDTLKVIKFCTDVFGAIVKALLYALPYEYIPLPSLDNELAKTYNDPVDQVYFKVLVH
ncbi:unnamed protein product [Dovyalis caffra]|uniref:Uncharacterized protein n=1 Tax=Dovyalis caffra TaxID=77055 RepID=A0AAV1SQ25_9ROSI|nr:unnamed protein product [Dovyalis caffra]